MVVRSQGQPGVRQSLPRTSWARNQPADELSLGFLVVLLVHPADDAPRSRAGPRNEIKTAAC